MSCFGLILERMLTYMGRESFKQEIAGDTEDRISNLPDVILTHILSFLPTKEAVKTGILSTRWKSVWIFVPTLDLNQGDVSLTAKGREDYNKVNSRFLNFVNQFLICGSLHFLEKVAISCSYTDPSHIESWICAARERNVRELHLELFNDLPLCEFPHISFPFNALVVLELSCDVCITFPTTSTCFPNLKVLKLLIVIYKDDSSAQNFISSCPVLEDLVIERDEFDNLKTLNVTSRALKKLSVKFIIEDKQDHAQKLVIDAPALESLDIGDNVTQSYVAWDLSSLIKAKLHVSNFCSAFRDYDDYEICLLGLLRRISNVKFLSLSCSTMSSLSRCTSYDLPTFENLTYLEILPHLPMTPVVFDGIGNWKSVLEFVKCLPVLETLTFKEFSFSRYPGVAMSLWDVPNCFQSHLKTIEITGLTWEDMEKVRYFLEKAEVLEKISIDLFIMDEELKLVAVEEILMFPRSSMGCQIEIC